MPDEHEVVKPPSDEKQGDSLIPLVLTPTGCYQIQEAGHALLDQKNTYLVRRIFHSKPTDPDIIFRNEAIVSLEELLLRQKLFTCLSNETVTMVSHHPCTNAAIQRLYGNYEFTPDYGTMDEARGGRVFDEGANIGLAYVLARRAVISGKVSRETVKAGAEELYKAAERVGVDILLPNLRTTMLRLIDKRVVASMVEDGFLSEPELPAYFESVARWQLELAQRAIEGTPNTYINPHPYSGILERDDNRRERRVIMPDARYLPAVFKIHKEYLEELLKSAGDLVVVEPSKVNTGVKALYEFAGRTIGFYQRPLEEEDQRAIDGVEELATTMSPVFIELVRQFNERFRKQAPKVVLDPVIEPAPPIQHGPNRFKEYLRRYGASAANKVSKKPGLGLRYNIQEDID